MQIKFKAILRRFKAFSSFLGIYTLNFRDPKNPLSAWSGGGKIFSVFFLTFLFISCSPIKRHQRLVEKYPFVHEQDSVIIRDTITEIIPSIRVDSVFSFRDLRDTITIEKERLKIRLIPHPIYDSIFIEGECDSIFIEKIIERKIPIRYYKTESSYIKWFVILSIIIFTLYSILRKRD